MKTSATFKRGRNSTLAPLETLAVGIGLGSEPKWAARAWREPDDGARGVSGPRRGGLLDTSGRIKILLSRSRLAESYPDEETRPARAVTISGISWTRGAATSPAFASAIACIEALQSAKSADFAAATTAHMDTARRTLLAAIANFKRAA